MGSNQTFGDVAILLQADSPTEVLQQAATLEHLAIRTGLALPELALALEGLLAAGWVACAAQPAGLPSSTVTTTPVELRKARRLTSGAYTLCS